MDDDWDLHAVVRGCATTVTTNATAAAAIDNSLPILPPILPSQEDQISFDFSAPVNHLEGLQEIYQEFCAEAPPPPAAASTMMSFPPPQPRQDIMQMKPPLLLNMQIQENLQFNITPSITSPPQNFPIPPPVRPRRRKNQQIKMVRQMTQEELSADSWAWRKYGQKPIKGSPYPRNYYRCSTSKGCAARKQVERSPHDPETFVVSYSGEHTHPRPTHRSSLAGSTRSKLASPPPKGRGSGNGVGGSSSNAAVATSSSSPAAGSSFSPATPSTEGDAATQNDDVQMAEEDDGGGEDDDENILMITSDLMNDDDDMFRGFQDSDDHSSGCGGDFFSMPSPPWTPTGSAATFNSGGGGGS